MVDVVPLRTLPISIHAPREGSDLALSTSPYDTGISIHAPREGSDRAAETGRPRRPISIHAPREGSDSKCAEK